MFLRRSRCLPAAAGIALLIVLLAHAPAGHAAGDARWRLARNDVVQYRRALVTKTSDGERLTSARVVTLHGHDLRDKGQYLPVALARSDLPALFAFRMPPAGRTRSALKADWKLRRHVRVRVKGEVHAVDGEGGALEGSYTFESRGKEDPGDTHDLLAGTATARIEFDPKEGVVRSARVALYYKHRELDADGPPKVVRQTFALDLRRVRRFRYARFQKEVDGAIDKGLAHLRTRQRTDGSFQPYEKQELGTTALATLTLLACDVPADDAAVRKALDWICRQEAARTYEQAVSLMALARAHPDGKGLTPQRRAWAMATAAALEGASASPGSWSYPSSSTRSRTAQQDSSNTQCAVLGLRAAATLGHPVQEKTWVGVIRHFRQHREPKAPKGSVSIVRKGEAVPDERYADRIHRVALRQAAGFRYSTRDSGAPRSSMTCAAISCLVIARHELRRMGSRNLTKKRLAEIDEMLLGAWGWLEANWAVDRHPGHPSGGWYYYYLYSLERAGVLDAVKRVGGQDWYFQGAVELVARQRGKGDWNHPRKDETPQTCFALLFLRRGTTPLGPAVTGR
jgi:hypothetical protein